MSIYNHLAREALRCNMVPVWLFTADGRKIARVMVPLPNPPQLWYQGKWYAWEAEYAEYREQKVYYANPDGSSPEPGPDVFQATEEVPESERPAP